MNALIKIKMKKLLNIVVIIVIGAFFVGCKDKYPEGVESKAIVLKIWTTEEEGYFKALGREFLSALQDSRVSVKVVKFIDDEELHRFLLDKMADGSGPDIIYTKGDWIARNTKKLVPRENDESFTVELFKNAFVRASHDTLLVEDKIWGVPFGVDSLALFYNEEHIAERLPDRNMPGRTWKEIQEDSEFLSKTDNSFGRFASSAIAMGRFDNIFYGFEILENIMFQMGTEFFTEDGTQTLFAKTMASGSFGQRENIGEEALKFFMSFADERFKHYSWSEFLVEFDSDLKNFETFLTGDVSMVFGYSTDFQKIEAWQASLKKAGKRSISKKNIRVTYFPQVENPKEGGSQKVIGKVYALAVPRGTGNDDFAWRFLKFAVRKENMQSFFKETKLPTARLDLIREQETEPHIGIFVRQAKFAEANNFPFSKDEFKEHLTDLVFQINEGKKIYKKGLESIAEQIDARLKNFFSREKELNKK